MVKFQLAALCALTALDLLAVASAQEVVLSFKRNLTSSSPNLITLRCEEAGGSQMAVADALFFRNGVLYMLPLRQPGPNGAVIFTVTREIEGSYQCAREESSERSNTKVIVGE